MIQWKQLQNGSDIRGIALEGVKGENVNLTSTIVSTLAQAFVQWIQQKKKIEKPDIAVGCDSRITGESLKRSFICGLQKENAQAIDCGLSTTPAMFMTTVSPSQPTDGAVMVTASHLPFNRNGLKFFTAEGGLDKQDITTLLDLAQQLWDEEIAFTYETEKVKHVPFLSTYAQELVTYIRQGVNDAEDYAHPLKGMHIIVDAGNGAGGFFASDVLAPLGAETKGSQFLNPDGHFPNHVPNPEDKTAMKSISDAVKRNKADLGIIFDTDVDRSALVDADGAPINRNALVALIASVVLREYPKSTVVTDSVTSEGLTKFIEHELGGIHHRFKRGYKNVINEGIRLNAIGQECHLAIETSGHAALKENYFLDDGAFLIAKLLVEAARLKKQGKTLHHLIEKLNQPAESKEIRFSIHANDFRAYGEQVLSQFPQHLLKMTDWEIVQPNYEGIRVRCLAPEEQGWFLLRLSLHDPVMPLNIESDVVGGVERIEERLMKVVAVFENMKA